MSLLLPGSVANQLAAEQASKQADAEREAMIEREISRQTRQAAYVEEKLKAIDPHLSLEFFGERADSLPGIIPGRWHIRRHNPQTLDSYFPLTTADGSYREPNANDAEKIKGADLWSKDGIERMRKRDAARIKAAEVKRTQEEDERRQELADHIKAYGNPGVSMANQGSGWRYRAGAMHQ